MGFWDSESVKKYRDQSLFYPAFYTYSLLMLALFTQLFVGPKLRFILVVAAICCPPIIHFNIHQFVWKMIKPLYDNYVVPQIEKVKNGGKPAEPKPEASSTDAKPEENQSSESN